MIITYLDVIWNTPRAMACTRHNACKMVFRLYRIVGYNGTT
jgi:hypothetical protein